MGTRNLTAVVLNGEYKIAQYAQWDGYPKGQGLTVLRFLRDKGVTEQFLTNLSGCRFGTEDEIKATWTAAGADPNSEWVNMSVGEKHTKMYRELSRDTGAGILALVAERPCLLGDSITFAADSLFCEWAYVVDLDAMTLEVYKGFNKRPLPSDARFKHLEAQRDGEYYPIRKLCEFSLGKLPSDEVFIEVINSCLPKDERE